MVLVVFNPAGYRNIIQKYLEAGYNVVNATTALAAPSPTMLLRHDVDFSLDLAVKMAEAEHQMGIRSTYYAMVSNEFYNVLDLRSRGNIARLIEFGHEIGLHWDGATYPKDRDGAIKQFKLELDILSSVTQHEVFTASQHRPASSGHFCLEEFVQVDVYSESIRNRFFYISDSSMRWRDQTPLELAPERRDIQFLSHPVWWFTSSIDAAGKVMEAVAYQCQAQKKAAENFLTRMNEVLERRSDLDNSFRKLRGWST